MPRLKILDRYLVQGFLAPFSVTVAIFSVLVVLGRFFDKMGIFNNFHAKPRDIALYLLLGLPHWLNMVLPIATMLALLFALGAFQQRGELTASRSAGIPTPRLYAPYFAVAFVLAIISMIGSLVLIPKLNFLARTVYRVQIKKGLALNYRKDHVVAAGQNHQRFTIGWLDVDTKTMKDVVVDRFDDNLNWIETVTAKEAHFENNEWTFYDGILRKADPSQPLHPFVEEQFKTRVVAIQERPEDFAFEDKQPDDMTGSEVLKRIQRLSRLGVATYKEKVAFHMKLALPFANLIVIALGIPFALKGHQSGRTQTFTYALGLAFLYWGMISVCQSIGEHGRIPAWLAAWMANIVFGSMALWMLRRAN